MKRVRAGACYRFQPVGMDRYSPAHQTEVIKPGCIVRVRNYHGCPKANTMGHCHVETLSGAFGGLVLTNSLISRQVKHCKGCGGYHDGNCS